MHIHREVRLQPEGLTAGATFRGYEAYAVQGSAIERGKTLLFQDFRAAQAFGRLE